MKSLNVFIVDDDKDFGESLSMLLTLEGHRVTLAFSGEEAVCRFQKETFDFTFMDVRLPGMNGVESFLEMRKIRPRAKVVMMTAYSMEQLLEQAVDAGAVGILHKPVPSSEIIAAIEDAMPSGIVLLADDDTSFVEGLNELLAAQGYQVLVAHTGQEALDTVLSNQVDVLLLDLKMPVLSGLEVYLELKKKGKVVPTIILTGCEQQGAEDILGQDDWRVLGCLVKPFDPLELLQAIEMGIHQKGGDG